MSVSESSSKMETPIPEVVLLIERMVSRENMTQAYEKVMSNKGAAGSDGMGVGSLKIHLSKYWSELKPQLLLGSYSPSPVLGVEIPKPKGGVRKLGIPTVVDRLIQQGILQVLNPIFDPLFSNSSYGFRVGLSAEDAVLQSQKYIQSGYSWVVDLDLEKFFDEVPHDVLMGKIRKRVKDKSILRLIRKYLEADVLVNGNLQQRQKGVPQGGPLSPLLSNILLDDLDKELEDRGHRFCRYADDCNIYVRTARSGERVKESITEYLRKRLKLKVNEAKSAVDRPWKRSFLGFTFLTDRRLKVSKESIKRLKGKLKDHFRRGKGRNLGRFIKEDLNPVIRGWITYYRRVETKVFAAELDGWIRRHLRKLIWRQWKRNWTRLKGLLSQGIEEERAVMSVSNCRGAWFNAGGSHMNQAFPKAYFNQLGLVSLAERLTYWKVNV